MMNGNERPTWDVYFLSVAKVVSLRSEDLFIKFGSVIVDEQKHIVGTGYNGLTTGVDLDYVDRSDRDARRVHCLHAEENAILNCHRRPGINNRYTIYVTGTCCIRCLERINAFGIKRVVYINGQGYTDELKEAKMKEKLIISRGIEYIGIEPEIVIKTLSLLA